MFRFTIRDVLWLTVVVALAVGWAITTQKAKMARMEVENYRLHVTPMQTTIRDLLKQQQDLKEQNWNLMQQASKATPVPPAPAP